MNVTATPAPKSAVKLEVELPPERLTRAVDDAVRRLSRRTRVPGFRPGKAPRTVLERVLGPGVVLDEAVDHLVQDAYREALVEKGILPIANPDVDVVQAEEGKPLRFTATVPVRPEVELGDYRNFNFRPEIETVDDPKVDNVIEELRDQNGTLAPVEDRGAAKGDYAVVGFEGTRDGAPFEGGSSERMPLILGDERFIPGFESNLEGLRVGESKEFDVTFPGDYQESTLAGQSVHFRVELKELREKVLPEADDAFAQSMGDFVDMAALRAEVRGRLGRNVLDKARHQFADKVIDYAVANATLELPDILVDQEVEVLHDEFRVSLARQGVSEEAYLKVVEKTAADLHADFKPRAEQRVKVLLVLTRIAEAEGIAVDEAAVEAEVERGRRRYAGDAKLIRYLASERGRNFIRSTLRRTVVVERLVDDWLASHPDHPALPHAEESSSAVDESALASAATGDAASREPTNEPTSSAEPAATTAESAATTAESAATTAEPTIPADETITEAGQPAGTGRAG
jgi:trigger factor